MRGFLLHILKGSSQYFFFESPKTVTQNASLGMYGTYEHQTYGSNEPSTRQSNDAQCCGSVSCTHCEANNW
jgi:hypothetical protein